MKLLVTCAALAIAAGIGTSPAAVAAAASTDAQAPGSETAAGPVAQPVEATLNWDKPVKVIVEQGGDELVLRFDAALSDDEIARFSKATGAVVADLRWNDDSLVLRAAPGLQVTAEAAGQQARVHFVPEAAADLTAAQPTTARDLADGAGAATELELARAQADAAAGYPGDARRRLDRLAAADPADPQVQRALADAEAAEGAIIPAARRYRALGADDQFARRIMAEADGRATAAFIVRDGKTFSQWEAGADAAVQVRDGVTVGAGVRYVHTIAQGVAGVAGYLPRISADDAVVSVNTGVLVGATGRLTGQVATLTDHAVTGAAARLFLGSPEMQARLFGAYRLPDFSTAEQAYFGGHLSRAGGGGTIRLTPELIAQADIAWNGYGLAGGGSRTETITATGGVDYLILRGRRSLQLSYRLDAEYVRHTALRATGIGYIPLSDRENHTVQAIFSMPVATFQVTAAAGWTKDRFGGNGPTASVGTQAYLGDAWRIEASGGVSSISRQAISGRQIYLQLTITRFLGR